MNDPIAQLLAAKPGLNESDVRGEYQKLLAAGVSEQGAANSLRVRYSVAIEGVKPIAGAGAFEATIVSRNKDAGRLRYWGLLRIGNETVSFTAFLEIPEAGSTISVEGAERGTYNNKPTVTLGRGCKIQTLKGPQPATDTPIGSVRDGVVNIEGRVLEAKQYTKKTDQKPFWRLTVGDATGHIEIVSWDRDPKLTKGQEVRLENVAVQPPREGRGVELVMRDNTVLATPKNPVPEHVRAADAITLTEARSVGESTSVEASGLVVSIDQDGSGIVLRCGAPQAESTYPCGRTLDKSNCPVHGKRQGEADLRIKGVLDDGEETITFYVDRPQAEQLLGRTMDDFRTSHAKALQQWAADLATGKGSPVQPSDGVLDRIREALMCRHVKLAGRLRRGQYEPQLFVNAFEYAVYDNAVLLAQARAAAAGVA
jgi:replication factor A1